MSWKFSCYHSWKHFFLLFLRVLRGVTCGTVQPSCKAFWEIRFSCAAFGDTWICIDSYAKTSSTANFIKISWKGHSAPKISCRMAGNGLIHVLAADSHSREKQFLQAKQTCRKRYLWAWVRTPWGLIWERAEHCSTGVSEDKLSPNVAENCSAQNLNQPPRPRHQPACLPSADVLFFQY